VVPPAPRPVPELVEADPEPEAEPEPLPVAVAPKPVPVSRFAVRIDEFEFHGEPMGDELVTEPEPAPRRPLPFRPDEVPPPLPPVPTWASRARRPSPTPVAPTPPVAPPAPPVEALRGDLALDPLSLRRRATIRFGPTMLTVDESRIALRSWWRRRELLWSDVSGFERRMDGERRSTGRLVALTRTGPVQLPATRRRPGELDELKALLEAYHKRAQLLAARSPR
jgi:hypothetical protein